MSSPLFGFAVTTPVDGWAHHGYMVKGARKAVGGWFLREWLKALNLRNVDLERATGFSKATISEAISEKPRHWRIEAIAAALKVPPEALSYPPKSVSARFLVAMHRVPADRVESALAMLNGLGQSPE